MTELLYQHAKEGAAAQPSNLLCKDIFLWWQGEGRKEEEKEVNAYLNSTALRGFNSCELATSDDFAKVQQGCRRVSALRYLSAVNKKKEMAQRGA